LAVAQHLPQGRNQAEDRHLNFHETRDKLHLWSVELFFFCMVIHLWGKFFMAAWRGKRGLTWVTGAIAFIGSIGTASTGYLSQTNFDSQWTAGQAKDGLNAVGVGAVFNVLDTGQMLLWHVMLLPLIVGVLIVLHVILVRRHGVVPPFDAEPPVNDASSETRRDSLGDQSVPATPMAAPADASLAAPAQPGGAGR